MSVACYMSSLTSIPISNGSSVCQEWNIYRTLSYNISLTCGSDHCNTQFKELVIIKLINIVVIFGFWCHFIGFCKNYVNLLHSVGSIKAPVSSHKVNSKIDHAFSASSMRGSNHNLTPISTKQTKMKIQRNLTYPEPTFSYNSLIQTHVW